MSSYLPEQSSLKPLIVSVISTNLPEKPVKTFEFQNENIFLAQDGSIIDTTDHFSGDNHLMSVGVSKSDAIATAGRGLASSAAVSIGDAANEDLTSVFRMTNTNELNFTVPMEVSFKFLKFNSPFKRAIIAAPTAPTDADSVGLSLIHI